MSVALSDVRDKAGLCDESSAAAPATCGDAIDVPLFVPYPVPLNIVLTIPDPGAARSTFTGPKFENPERVSVEVDAATFKIEGES